jgi:hypothetical protein
MGHRVTTLNVNTIEPAGNTLTIGASGDTVVIGNNDIRANTYKDAGGNTLFVSNGSGVLSSVNSGFGDSLKLLSTQTASNSASISFTSGITSTYKEYIFKFININPATDGAYFLFQVNATDGADYNDSLITSTAFRAYHDEADSATELVYLPASDQAQVAGFQRLSVAQGNGSDESCVGELHLFNPASTTYVKHFISQNSTMKVEAQHHFVAGYINDTTAIDDIQFKMSSGNFDGKIKMYGVL